MKKLLVVIIFCLAAATIFAAGKKKYSGINGSKIRGFTSYNCLADADIDSVKKWGGNTLRLMLMIGDLHEMKDRDTAQTSRVPLAKMLKIKDFVDRCRLRGILVIIDYHETPGLVRWSGYKDFRLWKSDSAGERFRTILVETWKQLALTFADYPARTVAYELFNEPEPKDNDVNAPENRGWMWDQLQVQLIKEIRKIDRRHTIIATPPYGWRISAISPTEYTLEGEGWKTVFPGWEPAEELLDDGKVMMAIHMYHPHDLTIQWAGWIKGKDVRGYPGKFTGDIWKETYWDKDRLRWSLAPADAFQKKYPNVPLIVTEFSVNRIVPGAAQYLRDVIDIFRSLKLGWTYHVFREGQHYVPGTDLIFELEPAQIPENGRKCPSTDPYDRFKAVIKGFKR